MSMVNQIPIFIINLDRRPDRMAAMSERLDELPFQRVSAVDGQNLEGSKYDLQIKNYKMTLNEIACILSHKKIWQNIIDNKIPYACILEDDVYLSRSFPEFMTNTDWLPDIFDVIKIETFMQRVYFPFKKKKARNRHLRQLLSLHYGSAGYIFSRHGAEKLCEIAQQMDRPVDHLLFVKDSSNENLKVLQLIPALCIQESVININRLPDSDIATERLRMRPRQKQKVHGMKKIWREIKRPFLQLANIIRLMKNKRVHVRVTFS